MTISEKIIYFIAILGVAAVCTQFSMWLDRILDQQEEERIYHGIEKELLEKFQSKEKSYDL